VLTITREIVEEIIAHARREEPKECCGILAGKDNLITHIFKLNNIETDPEKYWMDPREQIQTFDEIDRLNLELLGIYHSHPHSPPHPSPLDIMRAFYPTVAFFIISLLNREKPELRAFEIVKGKVRQKKFKVLP
jgi:proteasome lid subunit RPN8/RPN11